MLSVFSEVYLSDISYKTPHSDPHLESRGALGSEVYLSDILCFNMFSCLCTLFSIVQYLFIPSSPLAVMLKGWISLGVCDIAMVW